MLRKEKIISHPTEGFAKIKSRGSRNKINKIPSQHPHVPEIEKNEKKVPGQHLSFSVFSPNADGRGQFVFPVLVACQVW